MSTTIQRPSFYFGQYLGPDDLQALLDHSRGQLARHERYLHTPGIGGGLALVKTGDGESKGIKYVLVGVQAGIAVDGYGREIVVAEDQPLDISLFLKSAVFVKNAWHPVFLQAAETTPPPEPFDPRGCDITEPERVNEGYEFAFGRPGSENNDPPAPLPFDTGVPPASVEPWKILLGFVKFDDTISQFTDYSPTANGVGPRYAGVLADEVLARGKTLTLRSSTADGSPAIVVSPNDPDKFFVFGKQTSGVVEALVRITSAGNIEAEGAIKSQKASVSVESGFLSHGMPVPLPAGITQKMVDDGKVRLHIHVTPRAPAVAHVVGQLAVPIECSVSSDRLVTCLIGTSASAGGAITVVPGLCNYTIVAVAT